MKRLALGLAAVLLLGGCRVVKGTAKLTYGTAKVATKVAYGTAKLGTKVAVGTVAVAGGLIKDFAYYAARKAFYEKNHDSGHLSGREVRGVLGRKYPKLPDYKGEWKWPLSAGIVSSEFGNRWHKFHEGLDIAADEGEPLFASAAGRVIYSDNKMAGYGNVVIIRHDSKTTTLYAHNKKNKVKFGDQVEQGQEIALLGSTGRSTGPHVHFEMRRANAALNPRKLLPKSGF